MQLDLAGMEEQLHTCQKKHNHLAASSDQIQRNFSILQEDLARIEERLRNVERVQQQSLSYQDQEENSHIREQKSAELPPATKTAPEVNRSIPEEEIAPEANVNPLSEYDLYSQALAELRKSEAETAARMFQEYLEFYPGTPLADNAAYWLAECFYYQKKFNLAAKHFQSVIEDYPTGDKAAAATLKLGYSYFNIGDYDTSLSILKGFITKYPQTEEALLAQKMVDKITSTRINLTQ